MNQETSSEAPEVRELSTTIASQQTGEERQWSSQKLLFGDPLRPYVESHGRRYDFHWLLPLGREWAEEVAGAFARVAPSYSKRTSANHHSALRQSLGWIISNAGSHAALVRDISTAWMNTPRSEWSKALHRWRSHVIESTEIESTTKSAKLRVFNEIWSKLHGVGVVPDIRLQTIRHTKRLHRSKMTLGEVAGAALVGAEEEAIELLLQTLPEEDRGNPQTRDFLTVLLTELGGIPEKMTDVAAEIIRVINTRLAELRSVCEQVLAEDYERYQRGERLLAANRDRATEVCEFLRPPRRTKGTRGQLQGFLDPLSDQGWANILTYIDCEFDGVPPSNQHPDYGQSTQQYCLPFGGQRVVLSYLQATPRTLAAALALILIDTGFNVSTVRGLETDCLQSSPRSGFKEIHGVKQRAAGRRLLADVPVKSPGCAISAPKAVEILLQMTRRARNQAPAEIRNNLFLTSTGTGDRVASPDLLNPFKRIVYGRIGSLSYTLDMIRPSVALVATFESHGGFIVAQALADHSNQETTKGYTNRWPVRLLWEQQIRKFQELFEIVSIYHIEDAVARLGLSREQAESLFTEAQRTGLGVLCRDPRAGIQPGTQRGEICTRQEACASPEPSGTGPTCSNLLFLATVENTAELMLFHGHLREKREWMEANRSEKWERYWIPWYVFAEVVLAKMQRGPEARIYQQAQEVAERRRSEGVNFPPLY